MSNEKRVNIGMIGAGWWPNTMHMPAFSTCTQANVVAVCDEGQHLHVNVSLTQGSASGRGAGQGKCTGALESYPVNVPAQGRNTFLTGAAQAEAEAIIRDHGKVVDTQEWTRQVEILALP